MHDNDKHTIRRFIEDVLSGANAAAADRYLTSDFVDHQPWPGHPGDLAGFKAGLVEFGLAFPDARFEIERMVAEGDSVAALISVSGTHLGSFMGAPPTGRTFRIQALDLVRLVDGRMREHWGFMDSEALGRQLGLAPPA